MTDSQFHNQATPDRQEPGHTDNGTRTKAHNKKNRQQAENINITYANVTETVAPGGGEGGHTSGFTVTSPPLGGAVTDTVRPHPFRLLMRITSNYMTCTHFPISEGWGLTVTAPPRGGEVTVRPG